MPMYSAWATPKGGLPHSDIHGSKGARPSPRLFAACHVLHRLLVPRHPLNALLTLLRDWPPCAEPSLRKAQPITTTSHTLVAFSNAFARHPGPKVARRGQTHAAPYPGATFRTIFTLTKNIFGQGHNPPPSGVQGHNQAKPSGETFPETHRSTGPHATTRNGGGGRDRTDDPLLAKQVLSQLSYTPAVRAPAARPAARPTIARANQPAKPSVATKPAVHPADQHSAPLVQRGGGPSRI